MIRPLPRGSPPAKTVAGMRRFRAFPFQGASWRESLGGQPEADDGGRSLSGAPRGSLLRKTVLVLLALAVLAPPGGPTPALPQTGAAYERTAIPSSFNPVGSGARALGMGGAFIAVADDATAASWNPGGLIQLERPELSVVGAWLERSEDTRFGKFPEADGPKTVSDASLNYFSLAYPFVFAGRNMILSLNYQHLFDLSRDWSFSLVERPREGAVLETSVENEQSGGLYAYGLAYSVQVLPVLSLGFTLNLWEDGPYRSGWEKSHRETTAGTFSRGDSSWVEENYNTDRYAFDGFNFNLGILWHATDKLTVGAVFKSPFTADLRYRGSSRTRIEFPAHPDRPPSDSSSFHAEDREMDMPMSYGIGVAYRFSDSFTLSADVYKTHWEDFVHTDGEGVKTFPVSGLPLEESDAGPTHQVRFGGEYLFIGSKCVVPLRGGVFYDPAPAEGSPDDYYGFTLGTGLATNRLAWDVAYQYRFGEDVGDSILRSMDFSMDATEHTVYSSVILYF